MTSPKKITASPKKNKASPKKNKASPKKNKSSLKKIMVSPKKTKSPVKLKTKSPVKLKNIVERLTRVAEDKQSTITNELTKQSVTIIKKKCGVCVNCVKNNCRNCVYCKDMKKYGGSGKLKQSCSAKKCSLLVSTSKVKSMPKQIKKGILATSSSSSVLDHGLKLTPKKKVSFLSPVAIMQPHSFEMEAVQFLRDCLFEEMTSSEIEAVTFRKVKELWIEKKDSELSGEEKDILKSISTQFLGKLLQRSRKRSREDRSVYISPKKSRVSVQVQEQVATETPRSPSLSSSSVKPPPPGVPHDYKSLAAEQDTMRKKTLAISSSTLFSSVSTSTMLVSPKLSSTSLLSSVSEDSTPLVATADLPPTPVVASSSSSSEDDFIPPPVAPVDPPPTTVVATSSSSTWILTFINGRKKKRWRWICSNLDRSKRLSNVLS